MNLRMHDLELAVSRHAWFEIFRCELRMLLKGHRWSRSRMICGEDYSVGLIDRSRGELRDWRMTAGLEQSELSVPGLVRYCSPLGRLLNHISYALRGESDGGLG